MAAVTKPRANRDLSGSHFLLVVGVGALAVIALVLSTVSLAVAAFGTETSAVGAAPGEGTTETVEVELTEMAVEPAEIEIEAGTRLVLVVTNSGAMDHDLKLNGDTGTTMLAPGETEEVDLGVMTETARAWCTVPGHLEAGMEMTVNVTGGGGDPTTGGGLDGPAAGSDFASIDKKAEPEANWVPFDPALQPAPGGTEHKITMRATETVIEVAPGVTQEMWTYDDQVPGPTLRGKVGDLFTVTLVNEGEIGHSIDFHASKVAWNDEMRTINNGEELIYQFRAEHAGAYMYHCGTDPALHHIGNGMYGVIVIDPPELAPVDHEFILVQSELYLGPEGEPGDLTKMVNEEFDAVVFNGYWNQYKFSPIRVETNDRIRTWVVNDGPSENSAFHIVGTVFDTVWKEGSYLLRPDQRTGGSQVLDLQPAQGGFVEFDFAEDGFYPIVTHKFSNVGKGALGLFQAGDVELGAGAGH
jgi:nitrite reductase (NO-forming)